MIVVVAGAQNTGTSIVSGTVNYLGVDMGDEVTGCFENLAFRDTSSLHEVAHIISRQREDWGFKIVWSHQWIRHVAHYLKDAKFIFCYRDLWGRKASNPAKYSDSDLFRDCITQAEWVRLFKDLNISPLLIGFNMAQSDRIRTITDFLGIHPTQEQLANAMEFYNKEKGYHVR